MQGQYTHRWGDKLCDPARLCWENSTLYRVDADGFFFLNVNCTYIFKLRIMENLHKENTIVNLGVFVILLQPDHYTPVF